MMDLVWFRSDLRVADNPALIEACRAGRAVAVWLPATAQWRRYGISDRRLAFVGRAAVELSRELAALGIELQVLQAGEYGDAAAALSAFARSNDVGRVFFNREPGYDEAQRDRQVTRALERDGIEVRCLDGDTVRAPGSVLTRQGGPYSVFTPFKRRWLGLIGSDELTPLAVPEPQGPPTEPLSLDVLDEVPISLDQENWPAGESAAHSRLMAFLETRGDQYAVDRDFPAREATSRLSPYLAQGIISCRQCLHHASLINGGRLEGGPLDGWINELIWREFYRHVMALFPRVAKGQNFRPELDNLEWRDAPADFQAWQAGETGYPMVDAGMRQLKTTGWMHNRLRMVTAMFLTKHLLIDWRMGERHFMSHLIDGDFASNNGGWQWSASTGTDAAPYFRVFNPTEQGRRFDGLGIFIRHHVPELENIPSKQLFGPDLATVQPAYPSPIVDHAFARKRAIAHFRGSRGDSEIDGTFTSGR